MASSRGVSVGPDLFKRVIDVAWFVGLVGSVVAAGAIIAALAVGAHPRVGFPVAFSVHGTSVVAGSSHPVLGILVVLLAEVFRHGCTLQVDHDLTI